jgi:hypothetical protein
LIRLFQPNVRRGTLLAVTGGLLVGLCLVDKDISFVLVIPPLLVAIWRRWADRRMLWIAAVSAMVPTAVYLVALVSAGSLGQWTSQETTGLQRLLGIKKITGFGEGGHPSLLSTLVRQMNPYGLSYLICGLGILAAVYQLRRSDRPDVRLIACVTMAGVITLVYAGLFGTIETQMFYFPAVPALLSLSIAVTSRDRALGTRGIIIRRSVMGLFVLVLLCEGAVWVNFRTTPDAGMTRLVTWFQSHEPHSGVIANTTDVPQLLLQRYGYDTVAAATPQQSRTEHVRFLTILSASVSGNYSTLTSGETRWYESHGRLVYKTSDRSYGEISVYRTKNSAQW